MFSNVTSILTTAAMLLHSIFGCCTHHAHTCEHGDETAHCRTEHDGQHADVRESVHEDHHEAAHAACTATSEEAGHGCLEDAHSESPTAHLDDRIDHGTQPDRHSPCQQTCDDGDCRFTLSSAVKTPAPDEGQLSFPAPTAPVSADVCSARPSAGRADSGPPGAVCDEGDRATIQVWRL